MRINTPEARANNYTFVFLATVAYDALWTFARALNRTSEMVQSSTKQGVVNRTGCNVPGELVSLENFTYSNQFMGCIIRWNLERTDFVGISVSLRFVHILCCVYTYSKQLIMICLFEVPVYSMIKMDRLLILHCFLFTHTYLNNCRVE